MSSLAVALLTDLTGTGSPNIQAGELSRARFNLNGTGTIAARDSFNVSSFIDNGSGDYIANLAISFPDSDYTYTNLCTIFSAASSSSTSSAVRVICVNSAGTNTDNALVLSAAFGDKP